MSAETVVTHQLATAAIRVVDALRKAGLLAEDSLELPEPNYGPRWTETDDGEVQYRRWWVAGEGNAQDGYDVEAFGADVMLGGAKVPDPRALALALLAAHKVATA